MVARTETGTSTPDRSLRSAIGDDIRALRKRRAVTLSRLADQLGRSVGFVSQIERGLSEPSINDLRVIAQAFEVPISFFFSSEHGAESTRPRHVVRAGDRRQLGRPQGALVEELLSPDLGGSFEILLSEFAPGAELGDPVRRETEEAGYVVSGVLTLEIDDVQHTLQAGDSFRFAGESYRWSNPGTDAAVVVWVISPPVY